VALVGNPNCGKTALFNLLTGARQKVANYAGVTVERKVGTAKLGHGMSVQVIDLPGTYSLAPGTPDERITLEVIEGQRAGEARPDLIVAVVDATNPRMNLRPVPTCLRPADGGGAQHGRRGARAWGSTCSA
jgi:ferrous iron transport protein B